MAGEVHEVTKYDSSQDKAIHIAAVFKDTVEITTDPLPLGSRTASSSRQDACIFLYFLSERLVT